MTVSQILYGSMPSLGTMVLFCVPFGIFAIGAPGVPGGTVMALIGTDHGYPVVQRHRYRSDADDLRSAGQLRYSCNVTGDGALTLILTGYADRHGITEKSKNE